MHHLASLLALLLTVAPEAFSSALPRADPFKQVRSKRQSTGSNDLSVDLGYEIYQGVSNASTGLNTWKGYAIASPSTSTASTVLIYLFKNPFREPPDW